MAEAAILALLAKFGLLACTNVAWNEGNANTRVIHPLRPVVGNFYAPGKICCGRDPW